MAMGPCDIQNTYIDLTCNKKMGTEKRQRSGEKEKDKEREEEKHKDTVNKEISSPNCAHNQVTVSGGGGKGVS